MKKCVIVAKHSNTHKSKLF